MKKAIIKIIRFYQKKISPLFPPRCRYYPTCSQYAVTAIERFGIIMGGLLTAKLNNNHQPKYRNKIVSA